MTEAQAEVLQKIVKGDFSDWRTFASVKAHACTILKRKGYAKFRKGFAVITALGREALAEWEASQ